MRIFSNKTSNKSQLEWLFSYLSLNIPTFPLFHCLFIHPKRNKMALSYRITLEVLRFNEPKEVLKAYSELCKLWHKAANSNELWWYFCDTHHIAPFRDQITGKQAFKESGLLLNIQELPLVRSNCIVRYSVPDLSETRVQLSTPVLANQFTAYCYLGFTQLMICGGGQEVGNSAYSVDLGSGDVTELAGMQQSRRSHAAYKYLSSVYVFGGFKKNYLDTVEKYSIKEDKWEILPNTLANPMEAFVPARYRQDLYLVGALHIEVFTLSTETLRLFPLSLPQNWYYCLSYITSEGELVIAQRQHILSCDLLRDPPIFVSREIATIANGNYWTAGVPVRYGEGIYSFLNTHGTVKGVLRLEKDSLSCVKKIRY